MARFRGAVGYAQSVKTAPGVYEDQITERVYTGDILRNTRKLDSTDRVLADISVTNSISIVADAYASEHFFAIRYVEWAGSRWVVDDVEVRRPRLILRLGGVYNGPTP